MRIVFTENLCDEPLERAVAVAKALPKSNLGSVALEGLERTLAMTHSDVLGMVIGAIFVVGAASYLIWLYFH